MPEQQFPFYQIHGFHFTGFPVSSDRNIHGTLADGLSTSLFIMGLDAAKEYWQAQRDAFDMILMTEDGQIYITEGLENRCKLTNGSAMEILRG